MKCANVKKLATSTATSEGSFEVELPIESSSSTPLNCVAKIVGGSSQMYASRKKMVSRIARSQEDSLLLPSPLHPLHLGS